MQPTYRDTDDYEDSGTDALLDYEMDLEAGVIQPDDVPSHIARAMTLRRPRRKPTCRHCNTAKCSHRGGQQ